MGPLNKSAAALSGSFAPTYRFENLEIRKRFLRFPNLNLEQNPSLTTLAIESEVPYKFKFRLTTKPKGDNFLTERLPSASVFCERRAKRCVNIGKNEETVRKLLNIAFNSFQDFFFRLFAIRIKCNGDTSSVFQFECIEKTIIRNDLITFVKFTFNRTNITYSDNSFFERLLSVFLCASWENNLICIYYQCSAFFGKKTSKKYDTQQST